MVRQAPLRASEILRTASPTETIVWPSGEKAQALTEHASLGSSVARGASVRASLSWDHCQPPETIVSPSGEKAQAVMLVEKVPIV